MDWRHPEYLRAVGAETYEALLDLCVWNKSNAAMSSLYRSKHELVSVYRVFPDPAITLTAVDRLVHHATIFEMNVESYRRRTAAQGHKVPVGRQLT